MKIAFIDIGTNSVRYLAVSVDSSRKTTVLARGLAAPRLGRGLAATGRLRTESITRTLKTLARLKETLRKKGVRSFRSVGTAALRSAFNARDFTSRARSLGFQVRVLSGEEEAGLAYLGAAGSLPAVLIDVGGGSTEFITPGRRRPRLASLPLGAVRLKERIHFETNPAELLRTMRERCLRILKKDWPDPPPGLPLTGLGGTITTLAAVRLRLEEYDGERVHGLVLSRGEIEEMLRKLTALTPEERERLPGLDPARADIIIPGTVIVRAIMDYIGAVEITVSDRGLLFGLLRRFIEER